MEIIKFYVEAKRSKNFQTHTVGMQIKLSKEENKNYQKIVKGAQDRVNELAERML